MKKHGRWGEREVARAGCRGRVKGDEKAGDIAARGMPKGDEQCDCKCDSGDGERSRFEPK